MSDPAAPTRAAPLARLPGGVIACLGECMIELAGDPPLRRYGGDTLNTAVYLSRALAGTVHRVVYLSALGQDDPYSAELLAQWQAEGLDTQRVQRVPNALPGLYWVQTDAQGERRFDYWRSHSAARQWFAQAPDVGPLLVGVQHLHLSGISLALWPRQRLPELLHALVGFRAQGGCISFDNNFRAALWTAAEARAACSRVMEVVDVALLTLDDEQAVFGPANAQASLNRALKAGCVEVVIKQGREPAWVAHSGQVVQVPACPVARVVDTCAAGDAFAAAYLASRFQGLDAPQAAMQGHRLAAEVIQHPGAIMPMAAMPIMPWVVSASAAD